MQINIVPRSEQRLREQTDSENERKKKKRMDGRALMTAQGLLLLAFLLSTERVVVVGVDDWCSRPRCQGFDWMQLYYNSKIKNICKNSKYRKNSNVKIRQYSTNCRQNYEIWCIGVVQCLKL